MSLTFQCQSCVNWKWCVAWPQIENASHFRIEERRVQVFHIFDIKAFSNQNWRIGVLVRMKVKYGWIRKNFGQWLLAGLEIVSLAWPQCRCRPKSGWWPSPQLCSLKSAQEERAAVRDAARQDVHTLGGGRRVTHRHRQMQEGICSCSCVHNIDKQNANT